MNIYRPIRGELIRAFCARTRVRPMARPRLVGRKIYQPDNCAELTSLLASEVGGSPIERPILVDINIHFGGASKNIWPVSQTIGDEDNLRKSVNDSLVKAGVIHDDRFIIGGETSKIFAGEDYVWIFIYEVSSEVDCFRIGGVHA
jgi:Holliday junction resolvase RusA-like endonuclease